MKKTLFCIVLIAAMFSVVCSSSFAIPFYISGDSLESIDTNPASLANLSSTLNGTITDINIEFQIDYSWFNNLTVSLVHNGTTVLLTSGVGGEGDINLAFDDEASSFLNNEYNGSFKPLELLSNFDGMNLLGTWGLSFLDDSEYPNEDDNLISWAILGEYSNRDPVPEPATFLLLGSGLAGLAFYRRKRK